MQRKMQSGGAGCSISCRGSIEGLSLEWGEKGERVKMELIARIPQGMGNGVADSSGTSDHTSVDMIYGSKEHQNRWAGVCQEARTSCNGARHQHSNLKTLSVEKLHADLAEESLWSQGHSACALMLHVVPCAAELMISQQEPLEPSEAKPLFPSAIQGCSVILLALPLNAASPTRTSMRLTRHSGILHPRHSSVGVHAYQRSAAS
jgi:hypothetical protein